MGVVPSIGFWKKVVGFGSFETRKLNVFFLLGEVMFRN